MENWTRTVRWSLRPEQVATFRRALERPCGRSTSGVSSDQLPATYPITAFGGDQFTLDEVYEDVGLDVARALHTRQTFAWERALQPGESLNVNLTLSERIHGVSERAGAYVRTTLHARVIDAHRDLVLQAEHQIVELEGGHFPSRGDTADGPVGAESELGYRTILTLQRDDLGRYASAARDMNPIHVDDDFVRAAGGDEVVVHGMLGAGVATQLAWPEPAGEFPLSLTIRFKTPVWTQETLELRVIDSQRDAERTTLGYGLWGSDGLKTTCRLVTGTTESHAALGRRDSNGVG